MRRSRVICTPEAPQSVVPVDADMLYFGVLKALSDVRNVQRIDVQLQVVLTHEHKLSAARLHDVAQRVRLVLPRLVSDHSYPGGRNAPKFALIR
jgi:hypothetical protein